MFKSTVLITGASGFIGSHLITSLQNKKYKLIITPSSNKLNIKNKKQVMSLPKANIVIHLAGIASVPYSWKNPQKVMDINITGTVNILEYCAKYNAGLIFPSSYAYGNPKTLPTNENHSIRLENPYAVSKSAAESLCEVYQKRYGFDVTILRFFNIYGSKQSLKMLVPQMILDLIKNNQISVLNGKPKRDMIFVEDAVNAIIASLKEKNGLNIYNVGFGKSWSVKDLAEKLIKISGKNAKFIDQRIERPNEILNTLADIRKIQKELNWKPKINIDEGLKKTYRWFLNH